MNRREDPQFGYGQDKPSRQGDMYVDPAADRHVRRKPRRSILPVMIAGSAVIAFAGFMWISYKNHPHVRPGEVPVITAETGPVKVKPDDPGGMDIPFQDTTVYEELGGSKSHRTSDTAEHLLQPAEQPMPKPEAEPAAPPPDQVVPGADSGITALPPAPTPSPAGTTMPPQPDPEAALAPPPTPAPDTGNTVPPPPDTSKLPVPPPPPAKPTHAAALPVSKPAIVAAPSGNYAIQLGAFKDEPTANAEWLRLKTAHPTELGALNPIVEHADLGAKGIWYRLKAGPLPEDNAKQTCDVLKNAHVTCFAAAR